MDARLYQNAWLVSAPLGIIIGSLILCLNYYVIPLVIEDYFNRVFSAWLGYYVLCSIIQAHFFNYFGIGKPRVVEERRDALYAGLGALRHFVSIAAGLALFCAVELFAVISSLDKSLIGKAHNSLIIIGFFWAAFNDTCWDGVLDNWIPHPPLRLVIWGPVVVSCWLIVFYLPLGLGSAMRDFNPLRLNVVLGVWQWVIICNLGTGLVVNDVVATARARGLLPFTAIQLGLIRTAAIMSGGVVLAVIALTFTRSAFPAASVVDAWHSVLAIGTHPLAGLIPMALYSGSFRKVDHLGLRLGLRMTVLVACTVVSYVVVHGIMSLGFLNSDHHSALHHPDVLWNFLTSILGLTHHWFSGRWGFMTSRAPPAADLKPCTVDVSPAEPDTFSSHSSSDDSAEQSAEEIV